MAKKQGFASLPLPSLLPWPSCRLARAAHSFREGDPESDRDYLDYLDSTRSAEESGYDDAAEAVIRGLRSDRLFFEPAAGASTSATLVAPRASEGLLPFEGSVATVIESHDPYGDFRGSMEAMVAARGDSEWEWLEQMLAWYLTVNRKKTHGVILLAFLDLLLNLPLSSTLEIEDIGDYEM
ncbi:transcription repressor OFP13-like [Zingiber officinale]|uniref:transcription repressor OFP13-like n=1 Tax=Zingiber officinale TaxID=94328 RepID=UPI001C4BA071|nr:transcription repressor OFP13-like [Zingiber officinale]